ncbi:hypothetical protein ABFS83_06G196200 [Erythranthe nasuta]
MAEAALLSLLKVLGKLVIQHVNFLQGFEGQVLQLKDELEMMQCFLKDAARKKDKDERIRKWISDIREVAQDAEDVIETCILKVDTQTRSEGSLIRLTKRKYDIGEAIESIKGKLAQIDKRCVRYGIQNLNEGIASGSSSSAREVVDQMRRVELYPWQKDKHVVGLKEDTKLLLENAISDKVAREGLFIASIVGMGGSGKSTLAKLVYNHDEIRSAAARFCCLAWVCVSNEFNPKDVIKRLIQQVKKFCQEQLEDMDRKELSGLKHELYEHLKDKRYFIVVDDVWEREHWELLEDAFPDQGTSSRLLLTSRNKDISGRARYVYEMKFLDPKQSWELFMKKAFIENNEGTCPQDLVSVGEKIVKKCNGLPLAINVVGGLLIDRNPSQFKWERVWRQIDYHFGTMEGSVSQILELSYQSLSPELKSCFLCLGFFREDVTISAQKLVQVWIARGLVQQYGNTEETMEEIGGSYLFELINRNMVQVKNMSKDSGRVKSCYIHDLIRSLSIRKAEEEISFQIIREGCDSRSLRKNRHCAIYGSSGRNPNYSAGESKYIRSLFFHGSHKETIDVDPSYWKKFELLRILDFEDFKLKIVPDSIGTLSGLRYLGLRNTYILKLPHSLGSLKNLEVLDVAKNRKMQVVINVICKMDSLRHIYMSRHKTVERSLVTNTLNNLQTLMGINMKSSMLVVLAQITSLTKLGLNLDEEESFDCSLENLVRVTQFKQRGKLNSLPSATYFPPNLSSLTLVKARLREESMAVLEKLPKLACLKLDCAYKGGEMVISNEGFPKLKVLILRGLKNLKNIHVDEEGGGIPALERFKTSECTELDLGQLPKVLLRSMNTTNDH